MTEIKYAENWLSKVSVSVSAHDKDGRRAKTAIFISGAPDPEDIFPDVWSDAVLKQLQAEADVKGSELWKEYNKIEKQFARTAIKTAIPLIRDELIKEKLVGENYIDLSELKFVFDRYAGCSCPCSPGWRLKTKDYQTISYSGWKDVSIWINLETEDQHVESEKNRVRGAVNNYEYKIKKAKETILAHEAKLNEARQLLERMVKNKELALEDYERVVGEPYVKAK